MLSRHIESILEECGKFFILMGRVFRKPEKGHVFWRQFVRETDKLIIDSIPIVAIISVFIGAVLVLQTAYNLENPILPKMYVGYMTRESLALEFCSTMISLILAGKIGSNIASEIGSMRITEQIDAMEIMGINSAGYLILPKITSAAIFSPLLMLMSFILGLFGGGMIVLITEVINITAFIDGIRFAFNSYYIFYSMVKISVFCLIITSVSSYYGYYAKDGSLGVGKSSTRAIVISSGLILVFNLILTKLML